MAYKEISPIPIVEGGTNASTYTQSNGIVTYNGTSLVNYAGPQLSSAGIYTNTSQPAFFAYLGATVGSVTGDSTAYQVVFDTVIQDNTSMYFTSNGEIVPPVTGFYAITSTVLLDSISVLYNYGYITLWNNTASSLLAIVVTNPGALTNSFGNAPLSLNAVYYLVTGNAYSIQIVVNGGAKTVGVLGTGGFYCTYFSAALIC